MAATLTDPLHFRAQLERVFSLMSDGKPRTLAEISLATGDPQASVSARLRDLRKEKFGGYVVTRTYIADGIFTYALGA